MPIKILYKSILKPILFLFDPEFVHDCFVNLGELAGKFSIGKFLVGTLYKYKGSDVSIIVDGIKYKTPVMLSAGFDYNARLITVLDQMSFGAAEVGSITALPYEGNKKPRLTRAIKSKSIIVNKGLKNLGVDKIISNIKKLKINPEFKYGVSIARTNSIECATVEAGIIDYTTTYKKLLENNIGDYYTINISCPNAFGGENFADIERLPLLLTEFSKIRKSYASNKPIYIKMPIHLPWDIFSKLLDIIIKFDINGVVIGNLNKNYDDLDFREEAPQEYRGGLSGKPCQKLSNELIKKTREKMGKDFTIIGVGGILTPEDAIEKFENGANIVQLITGMIFEGPHLMKEICNAYSNYKAKD